MPNPSTYTQALAEEICRRLSDGETLVSICRDEGMPARRTVTDWKKSHPDFAKAYDEAMLEGCHALLDETLEIADNAIADYASDPDGVRFNHEHVQRSKLRVWTRHELIKRKRPDVFSDRHVLAGDPEAPLSGLTDEALDAKIQTLMKGNG